MDKPSPDTSGPVLRMVAIGLVMLVSAAVYFFRIDNIIEFCMSDNNTYLYLAQSLLDGREFTNIFLAHPTPQTALTPGFPLFLAGLIAVFGMDMAYIKAAIALCYLAAGFVFFKIFEREQPGRWRNVLILALIAASPFWLLNAREVVSGSVTVLSAALSVFFLGAAHKKNMRLNLVLAGLFIGLCLMTRIMGLLVWAALVFYILISDDMGKTFKDKAKHALLLSLWPLFWMVLWSARNYLAGSAAGTDYLSVFLGVDPILEFREPLTLSLAAERLALNLTYYGRFLFSSFWPHSSVKDQILPGQAAWSVLASLITLLGFWRCWRGFGRAYCLMTLSFLVVLLLWMERGPHFLNPVIPFIVFFQVEGAAWLLERIPALKVRRVLAVVLSVAWIGIIQYVGWNMHTWDLSSKDLPVVEVGPGFRMKPANIATAEILYLCQALDRRGLSEDDVVLTHSSMHVARLLGPVVVEVPWLEPRNMLSFMEQQRVSYVIVDSIFPRTRSQLWPVVQSYPERFEKIAGDPRLISGLYEFKEE